MTFSAILFYILAAIVLYGALRTVTAKNPVHAALHLVLTFCVSAMIWMLMQAEFLGVTLVVVYVGAVMVLFLFVVMMLNIDVEEMRQGFWRHAPAALVVGVLMAALLIAIFLAPDTALNQFGLMKDIPADYSNVRDLVGEHRHIGKTLLGFRRMLFWNSGGAKNPAARRDIAEAVASPYVLPKAASGRR